MQAFQIMRLLMLDRTPSRELQEHLWVFPMDYPIKLIGNAGEELRLLLLNFCQTFP
jgi:putative lipoic acid-binding regulatory protein